jgi:hypothetical protein
MSAPDPTPDMHMVQYCLVGDSAAFVGRTERLTDAEVRAAASCPATASVERFNRCPVCEAWTTEAGRLRREIDCPAIQSVLGHRGEFWL